MSDLTNRVLLASAFHAPEATHVEMLERLLIRIDGDGVIAEIWRLGESGYAETLASARNEGRLVEWPAGQYLLARICRSACPRAAISPTGGRARRTSRRLAQQIRVSS